MFVKPFFKSLKLQFRKNLSKKTDKQFREFIKQNGKYLMTPTVFLERVMGVEPTRPAWKAGILPLNYTRRTFSILSSKTRFVNTFFIICLFIV